MLEPSSSISSGAAAPIDQDEFLGTEGEYPVVRVLGSRVHIVQMDDIMRQMEFWISRGPSRCHQIVVTGFHGIWEAHKHPDIKRMLNQSPLWVPDGIAPLAIARLRGAPKKERTPGRDIMKRFFEIANEKGYKSFFYGDTQGTLDAMKANVERDYPNHQVVGCISPPFRPLTPEEDEAYIQQINDAKPDVVWVGLGLPRQERWIHERLSRLKVPVALGVGAAFRFVAGTVDSCPPTIGSLGLEWAYRLVKEPSKCWHRSLVEGPKFLVHVGMELTGLRKYN